MKKAAQGAAFQRTMFRELVAADQAALAPSFSLIRADLPLRLRR
jgi:hypothetical protein